MQRSITVAILLLIALAAGLGWLLREPTPTPLPTPNTTKAQAEEATQERANLRPASATAVREAAMESPAVITADSTSVLHVHAVWPRDEPARGVRITLRSASRTHGYGVFARARTDAAGLVTFSGVPPGRWSLRSDRGDRKAVDVVPGAMHVTFSLAEGVTVKGRVIDPREQPVDGASIWLQTSSTDWTGGSVVATSDADGRFHIDHVPDGVSLGALARDHVRSSLLDLDNIDCSSSPVAVTLRVLPGGGQLSGRVVNTVGKPLAGALVGFGKVAGRPDWRGGGRYSEVWGVRVTETDANGSFTLDGVQPGEHPLDVRCHGYGVQRSVVQIAAGETADVIVTMRPSGTLRGRVTGSDGTPLAGAVVQAYDRMPGTDFLGSGQIDYAETFGYRATAADDHGDYILTDVNAGEVFAFAQPGDRHLEFGKPMPHAFMRIEVPPGGAVEWDPVITEGRTIEGIVYYRDGQPMPNVFLTLIDESSGKQHTQTNDAHGAFKFVNLDDTSYTIRVQLWDPPKGTPPLQKAGVMPGRGRVELFATYDKPVKQPSGSVIGRIDDAGHRIRNAHATRVALMSDARWFLDNGEIKDGAFEFHDVTPCRFRLVLFENQTVLAASDWQQLPPGGKVDAGVLRTVPGGAVRVRIGRAAGTETVSPRLYFRREQDPRSTTVECGAAEELLVENLTPGSYKVTGYAPGMLPVDTTAAVQPGATSDLNLQLRSGTTTRFQVWFPEGRIGGSYRWVVTDGTGTLVRNRSGEVGQYPTRPFPIVLTLPSGTYTMHYELDEQLVGDATFTVADEEQPAVRIDLAAK